MQQFFPNRDYFESYKYWCNTDIFALVAVYWLSEQYEADGENSFFGIGV
jgi:hypothetical protein